MLSWKEVLSLHVNSLHRHMKNCTYKYLLIQNYSYLYYFDFRKLHVCECKVLLLYINDNTYVWHNRRLWIYWVIYTFITYTIVRAIIGTNDFSYSFNHRENFRIIFCMEYFVFFDLLKAIFFYRFHSICWKFCWSTILINEKRNNLKSKKYSCFYNDHK